MFKPNIYIKGERLDLFGDETITVNSSVQNIKDISRVFNDYSEGFTVPASPNNNKIFRHWYNYNLVNGFDARIRHEAVLEINHIPFKTGTIRLDGVSLNKNKPTEYRLTFFGQLIDLKETIGDDYLNVLDFSEYDFAYSSSNVITGLTSGLSSGELLFPLISTDKQWYYNSDVIDTTNEERLTNIANNGSSSVHGLDWTSLRPAIRILRIIEKIESHYGITFSRDFLGNAATSDLYVWLANADTEDTLNEKLRLTNYESVTVNQEDKGNFNNTTGAYIVSDRGTTFMREFNVRVDSSDNRAYTVQAYNGDNVLQEVSGSGDIDMDIRFPDPGGVDKGSQFYLRIVASAGKTIDFVRMDIKELSADLVCRAELTTPFTIQNATARIQNFLPNIKVADFLKSLVNKFNLTVLPTSTTSFDLVQLDDWYNQGSILDISKYIDRGESIPLNRPKIYKEIRFKYQEAQTILGDQFSKINNTGYGDLETKIKDANGKVLDGEEFEIELDFEQMVYERLNDTSTNSQTNLVYGLSLDSSLGDTLPSCHLLYIRGVDVSSNSIYYVDDSGSKQVLSANVYMPAHTDAPEKNYSTTFGSEIDEHDGGTIRNSLYSLYYSDYITDSFSINRRLLDVTGVMPLHLLSNLQLNDRLVINGDRFIINEMETNLTTQRVNFQLLNDIFNTDSSESTTTEEESEPDIAIGDPVETPLKATSFNISTIGASTRNGGCALNTGAIKYYDGNEFLPTLGDKIYDDESQTTIFNGSNNYYKINNNLVIQISSTGIVQDVYDCTAQGNQ